MKKIIALSLVSALALVSCKKECISPSHSESESTDFISSTNLNADGTRNAEFSKSNMKIAIRKVANKENTYKLVMKIDSVAIEIKNKEGVPQWVMIALDDFEKVSAGVTVINTVNPAESKEIFGKEGMRIRKVRENGMIVYESDAFQTDVNFDYELVQISYGIIGRWSFDDAAGQDNSSFKEVPFSIDGAHNFFMLPNGKAVYQNPTVEKVNAHGKWTHSSGHVFVETLVITMGNDPAQEIEKLMFVPDPIKIETKDPKEPYKILQLPTIYFDKTYFNQKAGVSRFSSYNRIREQLGYIVWSNDDIREGVSGVFYSVSGNGGKVTKIVVSAGGLDY